MTRIEARDLCNRLDRLRDAKMSAWNRVTADPSRSEEGRRQWGEYQDAARIHDAAWDQWRDAIRAHPHLFAPFATI